MHLDAYAGTPFNARHTITSHKSLRVRFLVWYYIYMRLREIPSPGKFVNHPTEKGKHIMAQKKTATKGTVTLTDPIFAELVLPKLYHSAEGRIMFRDRVLREAVEISVHTDIDFRKMFFIFFDKDGEVITVGCPGAGAHKIKPLLTALGALSARITNVSLEPTAINAVEIMLYEITA